LDEKKDMANVATPKCVLECDALYVKGYIEVKDGKIVSIKKPNTSHASSHISMLERESCRGWTDDNKKYYHCHFDKHSMQT